MTYPEGVEPGDPVVVSATGFQEKMPGIPAWAGHMRLTGGFVFYLEDGVPIADYGYLDSFRGQSNEDEDIGAAICAALAP